MDRRLFLKAAVLGSGVAWMLRPALSLANPGKVAIRLDKFDRLQAVGGWVALKIKDRDLLVIRDAEGSVRVLSAICSHQACVVAYNPAARRIDCPCHGSQYDLDGQVVHGPAPRGLKRYEASLEAERIVITLDE